VEETGESSGNGTGASSAISALGRLLATSNGREQADANAGGNGGKETDDEKLLSYDKGKLYLLKKIIEALTHRKISVYLPDWGGGQNPRSLPDAASRSDGGPPASGAGWRVAYVSSSIRRRSRETEFIANGTAQSEDGEEIAFSVSMQTESRNLSESSTPVGAPGAATGDPLVITFGNGANEAGGLNYAFDLNGDGGEAAAPEAGGINAARDIDLVA
jgi:hypothetical protein